MLPYNSDSMVFVRQKLHSEATVEIYVTFSYTLLSNKGGITLHVKKCC